jgi:hypothetical protein
MTRIYWPADEGGITVAFGTFRQTRRGSGALTTAPMAFAA